MATLQSLPAGVDGVSRGHFLATRRRDQTYIEHRERAPVWRLSDVPSSAGLRGHSPGRISHGRGDDPPFPAFGCQCRPQPWRSL